MREHLKPQNRQYSENIKNYRCIFCKSENIVKWCKRKTKNEIKQRYKCKNCSKCFTINDGFYRMKKSRQLITSCLDLYFNGLSLRKIRYHIRQFTLDGVSHMSVWRWIIKFSKIIKSFTDSLEPNLSRIFHADEIFVKCNKEQHYFWDMVDKGTRFLVSTHYSTRRDSKNAKILFLKAKHKPLHLFTDSLAGYRKAYRKVWGQKRISQDKKYYTRLKASIDKRNNIIERIQGTIRERIKVIRGFKKEYSATLTLELFCIWYNFIRVHQGIKMTPAEKAEISLNLGKNKWLDLILLSSN